MSADPNESTGSGHAAPNLSAKALACQQALREAADSYARIVARVVDDPRGPFIAELREAEERVGEAAASYALAFAEGERDRAPDE
ncbi:MAG: hypothetical protein ACLQNG_04525 [Acidimicrobiales bacterium]|jgi:hypothetical protein